jgi:thymidylate synthase
MYICEPYDDALSQILKKGVRKTNRTGIDTISIFGIQSRYKIDEKFPIITGRKVWPKSIFAELLWFVSGSTNNKDLQSLGSNIWTPWVDENFEKKHDYVQSSLGPLYGFQLRHFGGNYNKGIQDENYGVGGFDQLAQIVELLKTDPDSRRILFSLWNPQQLDQMRLAPCHYTFQLYVYENKLSGMLTQRSCDFPVGVPANIQFYSALIYMLAQQCGFEPYEFVHSTVDSHIYVDQIPAVEEYLSRNKPDSPRLNLNKAKDIFSYKIDDFNLVDYNPLPKIEMPVAV